MNKQQLASTIWESANQMRSKIEANEYKDFILGFIFYKYLSEREVRFFREDNHMSEQEIESQDGSDDGFVQYTKEKIGYFIKYDSLFSSWIAKEGDFSVADVRSSLTDFDKNINSASHKNVFENVFKTLQTGLSKLGESASAQTKAIRRLIRLIRKIPMEGQQDYDVLGFIYEYLIGMFAANAGKKAGEFYTPHEVSVLMSEIIAEHLKKRKEIQIYDPTSGSGSLLINIGKSASKYITGDKIKYYAQELKENTYNLTRMNLVMRGIAPGNINVRNGDALEDDWPPMSADSIDPLRVDAVVSNPPYSQHWDTDGKDNDPRFDFGIAPKSKADYAFLLHSLYHIKDDGIMTIVLPHGVLFRNEELTIRQNLIENNHIDAIIGLPENIFFGTTIATIIMVLKRSRKEKDVLIIDASKGYEKAKKNNRLRASDIKRIADTIRDRIEIPGFSRKITKQEIKDNGFNLNIPRYVDSSETAENWDVRATMLGGIPKAEIDLLQTYWDALPGLREDLFRDISSAYSVLESSDVKGVISAHPSTAGYRKDYERAFNGLYDALKKTLISRMTQIAPSKEEDTFSADIFRRLASTKAVDKYEAYQILDDSWRTIAADIEMIQTDGFSAVNAVDRRIEIKKQGDEIIEEEKEYIGLILPFALVQREMLPNELAAIRDKERALDETVAIYAEVLDSLTEEEKDSRITKEGNAAFDSKGIKAAAEEILSGITNTEIAALEAYQRLSGKSEKLAYMKKCKKVKWDAMPVGAGGVYSMTSTNHRIRDIRLSHKFPEDSYEAKVLRVLKAMEDESTLKAEIRAMNEALNFKTKEVVETMTKKDALRLLELKWIVPLVDGILALPSASINNLITKVTTLSAKYETTFSHIEEKTKTAEKLLTEMLTELTGNKYDMEGIKEFQRILGE